MATKSKTKKQATNESKIAGTSLSTQLANRAMDLPAGVKVTRKLQMPSLVLKTPGELRILAIVDAMRKSKVPGKKKADGTQEDPATICTVGDVQSGEMFIWLVPAVVQSTFTQEFNADDYVGRSFAVKNLGKREGKRHVDFAVDEVDVSGIKAA